MFSRVLIANRGEIALRIIRTARRLGIETVAVYSEADRDASWLRLADEAICIGPAAAGRSYLHIPSIIAAAEITDVEAIHPGYGFLAENAHFADVCRSCQIAFIGPPVEAMEALGDKSRARTLAREAGVPVAPGSDGPVEDEADALRWAHKIGYPVMIKAAAGGGGRGMRVAHNDVTLVNQFTGARAEAEAAFSDGRVYIERFIENPRHVEIQILADGHGNVVHLGERDCTAQRRHQKLIEESPSPVVDRRAREEMGRAAVRIARAAGYRNAGTVEFLIDRKKKFHFIEVNARIQVEHPVTEAVTGTDLIEQQFRMAAGETLGLRQKDVRLEGHALEVRVNAEDPYRDFAPSPGLVEVFMPPVGEGVRVDTHVYAGCRVPAAYDSLLAKVIVHAATREQAIGRMRLALDEFIVEGVATTIPLAQELLSHARFRACDYDTSFVEDVLG